MGPPLQADAAVSPGTTQWLDIRVIYVRVSAPAVNYSQAPERLVLRCSPRDIRSELEMNGARIPPSEPASLTLRLDRVDDDTSEAMYVSTDKLRLSSCFPFAIFHNEEQLAEGLVSCREGLPAWAVGVESDVLSSPGSVEWNSETTQTSSDSQASRSPEWGMRLNCTVSQAWRGFVIKSIQDLTTGQPVQPSLEVCVVGKCSGASIMLTDQVQLLARKRSQWKGGLDAIPEAEQSGRGMVATWRPGDDESQDHFHEDGAERSKDADIAEWQNRRQQQQQGNLLEGLWPTQAGLQNLYGDADENGEMTWFNAGVRVGVGIGLGMCIGMGIGVGLIVKTYQATTRPFRGRLL